MILNGLELSKNYNNQILNRNTLINGKCNNDVCDKSFEKNIRQMIDVSGPVIRPKIFDTSWCENFSDFMM